MACPICDHTMQNVGIKVFWCPRCGTVKMFEDVYVPRTTQVIQAAGINNEALSVYGTPFGGSIGWECRLGKDAEVMAETPINAVAGMAGLVKAASEARTSGVAERIK